MSDSNETESNVSGCQAKRGFFTLYDCSKPSTSRCKKCQRSLCAEHFPTQLTQCLECEAKSHSSIAFSNSDQTANASKKEECAHHDLLAAYHKRDKTLSEKKGIYLGKNLTEYYQTYDMRSFDIELSNIADLSDSPDEVFFDS